MTPSCKPFNPRNCVVLGPTPCENRSTMLGLIQPKLVYLDLPLFMALLSDLFPGVETPPAEGGPLKAALEAELREANLQVGALLRAVRMHIAPAFVSAMEALLITQLDCTARPATLIPHPTPCKQVVPAFVSKIVQIFDCKVARHGNMIVGRTGAGKSEAWRCLARAMARLRKEGSEDPRFQKVGGRACGWRPAWKLAIM